MAVVNTWVGGPVDLTKLPIGTGRVSTTAASVGGLFACVGGTTTMGGAMRAGPWIDEGAGTWDATRKVRVAGAVGWPMARFRETLQGEVRRLESNGLPVGLVSGTFPIAAQDPAYAYDRNPNSIGEHDLSVELPRLAQVAARASCLPMGAIGILRNGVAVFAAIDARQRDAVAYETQDVCDGHPGQTSRYHYHEVPSCIRDAATGPSTVVGFAADGFPIVVERDAQGRLPTNADLDECHGRSSPVSLDGAVVSTYHYSATAEFPYFMGCYRGARPLRL